MVTFFGETENDHDVGDFFVAQYNGKFTVAFHTETNERYEYRGIAYQGDDISKALQTLAAGLGWHDVWATV